MNLALFDFDGTITTRDSLPDFIQFAVGRSSYYLGLAMLSPFLLRYLSGMVSNHHAKQKMIAWFFKAWQLDHFRQIGERYSRQRIEKILRIEAMDKIQWHRQQGDRIIVVSASMEDWLSAWCSDQNLELLSTRLASEQGMLTGKFETPNCHGVEKVRRIKALLNLSEFEKIYAYGDSKGDTAMLALADEAFYRRF